MEKLNNGMMEDWNAGMLECWNGGIMEDWKNVDCCLPTANCRLIVIAYIIGEYSWFSSIL